MQLIQYGTDVLIARNVGRFKIHERPHQRTKNVTLREARELVFFNHQDEIVLCVELEEKTNAQELIDDIRNALIQGDSVGIYLDASGTDRAKTL